MNTRVIRTTVLGLCLVAVLPGRALDGSLQRLLSAGRVDELVHTANARIKASPQDSESYFALGRAYLALRDWDRAVAGLERAAALAPANSEYHMWLGRAYGEKAGHVNFLSAIGWAKKSRREFEQAVTLDPGNVAARSDLAEFCIDAPSLMGGGIHKARQQAELIEKQDPALAHFLRGRIADKQQDRVGAEQEMKAAVQAGDDKARYWINLASFYDRWGRKDDMTKAIASAVTAPAKRTDVVYYAAELLVRDNHNLSLAESLLRKYLAAPDEEVPAFRAHYELGTLLEKRGSRDEATREYEAALALAAEYDQPRQALRRLQASRR